MATLQKSKAHWRADASYSKSANTRDAILQAALTAFAEAGFAGVSTRQIAAAAGVNQPAINYYFKNKEGLYQACAEEILSRYQSHLTSLAQTIVEALEHGTDSETARRFLKDLLSGLADVLLLGDQSMGAASFIGREMREPGLAYTYLYENFWGPGTELVAGLITTIKGHNAVDEADRIEAIMLITNLLAFAPGHSLPHAVVGWSDVGKKEVTAVLSSLSRQIDAI